MRITILTYVESEGSKDYDPVVEQVRSALSRRKHEVAVLGVHQDVQKLVAAFDRGQKNRPDLVFNLLEMFGNDVCGDVSIVGVLDALSMKYTGSGPGELYLAQNKAITKKLLAFHGIRFPNFAVFGRDADLEIGGNLRLPLFVKPLRMDASIGIDAGGLVHDSKALMKRVSLIHGECQDSALAEEYIEGREFYVGILGNQRPTAFPPIEMDFSKLPDGKPHVLDAKAKFEKGTVEYEGTNAVLADVPSELRARLQQVSIDAYRAVGVRDYGRVDLRLTESGDIYVLEVNASCYLEQSAELSAAARAGGVEYDDLVERIVSLASARYAR
jgi:D-alanine-D-alanine ligase